MNKVKIGSIFSQYCLEISYSIRLLFVLYHWFSASQTYSTVNDAVYPKRTSPGKFVVEEKEQGEKLFLQTGPILLSEKKEDGVAF